MTAFPQLVRCFAAQYRGLTDEERRWLEDWRVQYNAPIRIDLVSQRVYPIWTAGRDGLFLISVKVDAP